MESAAARRASDDAESLAQLRTIEIERTTLRSSGETYPRRAWFEVQKPSSSPHTLLTEGRVFEWPLLDELDKAGRAREMLASAPEQRHKRAPAAGPAEPKPAAKGGRPPAAEKAPAKKAGAAPPPKKESPAPAPPSEEGEETEEAGGTETPQAEVPTEESPEKSAPAPAAPPAKKRSRARGGASSQ